MYIHLFYLPPDPGLIFVIGKEDLVRSVDTMGLHYENLYSGGTKI
jgi:hypothetical protein